MPGHFAEAALADRRPKLFRARQAERARDVQGPLRGEAQIPPEPDDLGRDGSFELLQLDKPACFHELSQARLDRRADAPKLGCPAAANQRSNVDRRPADQASGATICPGAVRVRAREIEENRECLEAFGERLVVERSDLHRDD